MTGTYVVFAVLGAFFMLGLCLLARAESKVTRRDESARNPILRPHQTRAPKRFL
jgi:hypothetical protein